MTEETYRLTESLDEEAVATAQLVMPVVMSRLESDPAWALAMLAAIKEQLVLDPSQEPTQKESEADTRLVLSSGDALGLAHAHANEGNLQSAAAFAQLALSDTDALGDNALAARMLLASVLERQGRLVQAAKVIAEACEKAPGVENAQADRDRIVNALRAKAQRADGVSKADKVAILAQIISTGGWTFGDAKAVFRASLGLLRGK